MRETEDLRGERKDLHINREGKVENSFRLELRSLKSSVAVWACVHFPEFLCGNGTFKS